MTRQESKYFSTAVRMDEALLELLGKKDFSFITIKEVCSKAGVNRSTFYLHYETLTDLLEESIAYIQKQFYDCFPHVAPIAGDLKTCPPEELLLITPAYLRPYLQFVQDNRLVYKAAIERPSVFRSDHTYQNMFREIFDPILERFGVPTMARPYQMSFYLSGISAIVSLWIQGDCTDSIDDIIDIIQNCIIQNHPFQ